MLSDTCFVKGWSLHTYVTGVVYCSEYDSCNPVICMQRSTGDWLLHKQTHISPATGISDCRTWRIVGPDCRSCSWCGGRWEGASCRGRGGPVVGFSEAWSYTAAQKETSLYYWYDWELWTAEMYIYNIYIYTNNVAIRATKTRRGRASSLL